jgi:hypothetical protein
MTKEIIGYYIKDKHKLLRSFDQIAALMTESLIAQYGEQFAGDLVGEIRQEYERLIPQIPYIKGGYRTRALGAFVVVTAQEIAVYKAMKKFGKSPAEAWELCHKALRLRLAKYPTWKRWLLRKIMFAPIIAKIFERRAKKNQRGRFGNFEIEYVSVANEGFDIGVNYHQCSNLAFAKKHGAEEFAPYICMSDIALSDALGWGLVRTQTLADGCRYCDFRFKQGATTQISSKTLEVQETIDRIREKERLCVK